MKKTFLPAIAVLVNTLPFPLLAQPGKGELGSYHLILENLYREMMPLCSSLIGVGQGLAGFATLCFISSKVWKHIAAAEPVDFYPLFRPFVIGFCISVFPSVLGVINGIMAPTVTATSAMVTGSRNAIEELLRKKKEAIMETEQYQVYVGPSGEGDREGWYRYTHPDASPGSEGMIEGIGNDIRFAMSKASYNFRNSIKEGMSEILSLVFQAAALCIDTLRTFQMVVLSILGPLVFGLSVFGGFEYSLVVWLARYINVFLWLPVANIFGSLIGKIQENMLRIDLSQIEGAGDTFFSRTDAAYMIFLLIGTVGYFTVPSIANLIVNSSENGAFVTRVTQIFQGSVSKIPTELRNGRGMVGDSFGDQAARVSKSMQSSGSTSPYFNQSIEGSGHNKDRLRGNR
ncbi:conjugative transposon protein TraJ [Sphingobacterium daejeonense]|uniref:Conjugative transposon protein TraJ n=1 Tax=Sphingobacterium daejeonense TaxID=371142 RepID=A0ABW3RMT2_9SPHI